MPLGMSITSPSVVCVGWAMAGMVIDGTSAAIITTTSKRLRTFFPVLRILHRSFAYFRAFHALDSCYASGS
jgi:hypothetical protein